MLLLSSLISAFIAVIISFFAQILINRQRKIQKNKDEVSIRMLWVLCISIVAIFIYASLSSMFSYGELHAAKKYAETQTFSYVLTEYPDGSKSWHYYRIVNESDNDNP